MNTSSKTFRRKLILYNMAVIICIAITISVYNYNSYRKEVVVTETRNSIHRISNLYDRMELAYDEMINILLNCTERKSFFPTAPFNTYKSDANAPIAAIYAANTLNDLCAISSYAKYIYKITLYNKDSVFFFQAGNLPGSLNDPQIIMNTPWFHEILSKTTSQYALQLVNNPFPAGNKAVPQILPLLRPLSNRQELSPTDAWVFLAISPQLFTDAMQTIPTKSIACITTAKGTIISSLNPDAYITDELIQQLLTRSQLDGVFTTALNNQKCVITYQKQPVSGLLFFEVLPIDSITLDISMIWNTVFIIFFFCIVIGLTLSLAISRQLGAPISRLTKRLQLIANGDFQPDSAIETDDEIGIIGKQINQMSSHISTLMDTRIQDEKEKKDMEIKMLQAQINPHFLYNTLDSIKWIATMQKSTGIVQVVTALSSLLKNMAKGFNEKVTLRQELDFLQNYITIEKIRYIELFDVEVTVDSDALYNAKIIKLTLQPIVENAIFSGIEPSGRFGLIQIHAFVKNGILYVTVTDNGIGITPENIQKLLTDTSRITKSNMSGIGLPNVDRRLKLVYGEDYGITIESELDQYTTITISLPLEC